MNEKLTTYEPKISSSPKKLDTRIVLLIFNPITLKPEKNCITASKKRSIINAKNIKIKISKNLLLFLKKYSKAKRKTKNLMYGKEFLIEKKGYSLTKLENTKKNHKKIRIMNNEGSLKFL